MNREFLIKTWEMTALISGETLSVKEDGTLLVFDLGGRLVGAFVPGTWTYAVTSISSIRPENFGAASAPALR